MGRWWVAGFGLFWALACTNPMAEPEPEPVPDPEPPKPLRELVEKVSVSVGDGRRGGLLHVPEGAEGPMPLVVVLHGGQGGEGRRMVPLFEHRFDDGVAFLFPNGHKAPPPDDKDGNKDDDEDDRRTPAWRGVGNDGDSGDLDFVKKLVKEVESDHDIDEDKVFVVGHSSGGAMAFQLGCLASDVFHGVGVVSQTLPRELAKKCKEPLPVVLVAGTEDEKVLWTGRDNMLGVMESIETWLAVDGCDVKSATEELLEDIDIDDGVRVKQHDWTCTEAPVRLYELAGGGHGWPGSRESKMAKGKGRTARDIDGADTVLDFLMPPADD